VAKWHLKLTSWRLVPPRLLTYMATLDEIEAAGDLIRIDVPLDGDEQIWRRLYGTPAFVQWLDGTLPTLATTVVGGETTPAEQLDARFHEYVVGEPIQDDRRFKTLSWTPERHVWEFKTLDLRVFGWVPMRDHFICTFGDTKDRIELLRLYGRYIAQTAYVREQLPLDEPKFVPGKEYSDVLSNTAK
jgi:hypothetical protein